MKIDLKISSDMLIACNSLLQDVYTDLVPNNESGKLVKSIIFDVADKLDSKCKSLIKKSNLFEANKKQKLILKYHEAWALLIVLSPLYDLSTNDYNRAQVQKLIHLLHQKLT